MKFGKCLSLTVLLTLFNSDLVRAAAKHGAEEQVLKPRMENGQEKHMYWNPEDEDDEDDDDDINYFSPSYYPSRLFHIP